MSNGRFNERTQNLILEGKKESINFKHGYVGTEHILLGILKEGGYASILLNKYNISYEDVKGKVESYLGFGDVDLMIDELLLTPRTKHLLEISAKEAQNFSHAYINPEHILLALLKENDGVAYTLLSQFDNDMSLIKKDIISFLENTGDEHISEDNNENLNKDNPVLKKYSVNMTKLAKEEKFDPLVGRDKEIQRVLEILCRRAKNNPCLIGEPGVGKTAIIEGLAQKIIYGNIPEILKDKQIYSLDISNIIAC